MKYPIFHMQKNINLNIYMKLKNYKKRGMLPIAALLTRVCAYFFFFNIVINLNIKKYAHTLVSSAAREKKKGKHTFH